MSSSKKFLTGIAAAAVISLSAQAAHSVEPSVSAEDWLIARIRFSGDQQVTHMRTLLVSHFYDADADGGGVAESDYELHQAAHRALTRANELAKHLARDLDGDGTVTRAELERSFLSQANKPLRSSQDLDVAPTSEQIKAIMDRRVTEALSNDSNKNGTLEFMEMYRDSPAQAKSLAAMRAQVELPPSFDSDRNGVITLMEYEGAVSRVLDVIDADKNGIVTPGEAAAIKDRQRSARMVLSEAQEKTLAQTLGRERAERCGLPKVPDGAKVVYISAREGTALSNLSIGGDDTEVTAAHAFIEAGEEQLYIVAVSRSAMIWHVTGDVGRVAKFVAGSMQTGEAGVPRAAVSGLGKDKVEVPPAGDCLMAFNQSQGSDTDRAAGTLKSMLGRPSDVIVGAGKMAKVSVPSGVLQADARFPITKILPKTGHGAPLWREAQRVRPAGLADIATEGVVASLPVTAYAVLPSNAGLAQLVDEGALEMLNVRRVHRFGNIRIIGEANVQGVATPDDYAVPSDFKIIKKMRFPAGLNGGHSVRFVLAKGVPMPEGSPGHSEVLSEETGATLTGR